MSEILYIVMPAYNEEANIKKVIDEWYPILQKADNESRLIVADSGSSDKTHETLEKLKKEYSKLEVLSNTDKQHGPKVIALYKYCIESGADWIFQTDSDGQTIASEFSEFWQLKSQYDVILGNRKKRGDGYGRKLVENVLRGYLKVFFGVLVPDANAPFRLMRSSVVEKYIGLMPEDFNLPNAILSACFAKYKEKVTYRVVTFQPRQGGKNHMNIKRIFKIGAESIRNFLQIKDNMKVYEKSIRK